MRFASCFPFSARVAFALFKGDETENQTQSTTSTAQTDNRVGASENGVAVGSGGMLDQSFSDSSQTTTTVTDNTDNSSVFVDQSQTTLNTTDASNRSVNDSRNQSFNDSSQTTLNTTDARTFQTTDASNRSDNRDQSFKDYSQTTLNTTDARQFNQTDSRQFSDSRDQSFTDNSQNYTLDGELSKAALQTGANALRSAGDVLGAQIASSEANAKTFASTLGKSNADSLAFAERNAAAAAELIDGTTSAAFGTFGKVNADSLAFAGAGLERAFSTAAELATLSIKDSQDARAAQTGFLSSFYRDRESTDSKQSGDIIKYGSAAAIVGLLAWALKTA